MIETVINILYIVKAGLGSQHLLGQREERLLIVIPGDISCRRQDVRATVKLAWVNVSLW